ncbi:MAG: hypothetical protein AAGH79_07085 [Bacteroidota bacterium]
MKNFKFLTLLSALVLLVSVQNASAVVYVQPADAAVAAEATEMDKATKKEMKRQARLEKRIAKFEKKLAKKGMTMEDVDFSDPVQKWLWFALFGWGAGIVLSILATILFASLLTTGGFGLGAVFWLLASLCYAFGSISFIVWLIKKLS